MTHAEVMALLFDKQERWLEAQRILIWEMEFRRRIEILEEDKPCTYSS